MNDSIDSVVVKSEDFCSRGRWFESQHCTILLEHFFYFIFFSFDFFLYFVLISRSKIFQNAPKSNWCGGRRGFGEGHHTTDNNIEGTLSRPTSNLPEKLQKPVKQRRVYSLDECTRLWMLKINWNYIVLNFEIRWNLKIIQNIKFQKKKKKKKTTKKKQQQKKKNNNNKKQHQTNKEKAKTTTTTTKQTQQQI